VFELIEPFRLYFSAILDNNDSVCTQTVHNIIMLIVDTYSNWGKAQPKMTRVIPTEPANASNTRL
jgi:hypothetical protein